MVIKYIYIGYKSIFVRYHKKCEISQSCNWGAPKTKIFNVFIDFQIYQGRCCTILIHLSVAMLQIEGHKGQATQEGLPPPCWNSTLPSVRIGPNQPWTLILTTCQPEECPPQMGLALLVLKVFLTANWVVLLKIIMPRLQLKFTLLLSVRLLIQKTSNCSHKKYVTRSLPERVF